jgi:hypothetical protein
VVQFLAEVLQLGEGLWSVHTPTMPQIG